MKVHGRSYVDVIDHMGDDLRIVEAARVSFDRTVDGMDAKGPGLIGYLARNQHWTPFGHVVITLRLTMPVFVARQWMRSNVGACVAGDTRITFTVPHGGGISSSRYETVRHLAEIWAGEARNARGHRIPRDNVTRRHIRVLNTTTGKFGISRITDVFQRGVKRLYKITDESGATLRLTEDHRVWTKSGWQTLKDAVGLSVPAVGVATMSRECWIGKNGLPMAGTGEYRSAEWLASMKAAGKSVDDMAAASGATYHTVRKWLKVHGLQFDPLQNLSGMNGKPSWNKGRSGYRNNRVWTEEQKNRLREARAGQASNFWRGGTTKDRKLTSAWTVTHAPKVHARCGHTCQKCGTGNGKLYAHHVVPVSIAPELGRDLNNLVSVCQPCHRNIHRSVEAEQDFAALLRSRGVLVADRSYARPIKDMHLGVHFKKVVRVELDSIEPVYDISVESEFQNFVADGFVVHNCRNEVSRRYVDTPPEYYLPVVLHGRPPGSIKQGAGGEHPDSSDWLCLMHSQYRDCHNTYVAMVADGVAPEEARLILPLGHMTSMIETGSIAYFGRVVKLRRDGHAQGAIRDLAELVSAAVAPIAPLGWAALLGDAAHQ